MLDALYCEREKIDAVFVGANGNALEVLNDQIAGFKTYRQETLLR